MRNLPRSRVTMSRPFSQVGVDYAGPIMLRANKGRGNKRIKGYICVFVCLCTKAMHMEIVTDSTSESFLAAFRCLVGRRGRFNIYIAITAPISWVQIGY